MSRLIRDGERVFRTYFINSRGDRFTLDSPALQREGPVVLWRKYDRAAKVAALLIGALEAAPARGDEKAADGERPDPPIDAEQKRRVPDYDGRGEDPTTLGDVLIWVPRVALSPLYLVSEYVVRRPLGWLISTGEEEQVPQKLVAIFTFGPEGNIGIVPTFLVDFGFQPSAGLYFFWTKLGSEQNALRARAATGGTDWLLLNVADRVALDRGHEIGVRAEYGFRPDLLFHGIGPESGSRRARYKATHVEAGLQQDAVLFRSSRFSSFIAARHVSFDPTRGAYDDPTVAEEIARGRYPAPPGLSDGYTLLSSGIAATFDTRKPRHLEDAPEAADFVSPPGTGARIELRAEQGTGLDEVASAGPAEPSRYQFLKYGATLGGFVDLTGTQRVIGLSVIADFADPLHERGSIPFTEQVFLGGERPMRGFLERRLIDRSSAVALFEYQWPIWVWLDGALHYSVGNVFGAHLNGFEARLLRQSYGIGVRTTASRDHPFEVLLAFGTRTFADGGGIENVRFVFGASSGF